MSRRFVLGPEQKRERIDRVLSRQLPGVSRAAIQRWITEGRVWLDGRQCKPRTAVGPGSVVEVEPGPPPPTSVQPDASVPFRVEYEDADLIVVEKPPGIVVHPGRGHWEGTLVAGLLARPGFERVPVDAVDPQGYLRPGIVHRIDKGTSGLLVVAKHGRAREGLKEQLAAHSVERRYRAITVGVPASRRIDSCYGRHPRSRVRFTSRVTEGRRAVTHVAVDEALAGGRAALVTCTLETGRTHQIRVHLSEVAGTPLLADATYAAAPSDPQIARISEALGRQALHAQVLGFEHPISGRTLRFEARLPDDMALALASLRALG